MRIRTRIQLIIVLSVVLAATVGLLLFLSIHAMNEASRKAEIAAEVVKGVVELKILTGGYLLHPGDRSLIQWRSRYDSVTRRLTGGYFRSPDEKIPIDEILKNLERIKTVFTKITIDMRKKQQLGKQESAISRALQDRLEAELLVKAQATVSLVFPLQQKIQAELVTTQKRATFLTVILLLTLTAIIVGISLWINRSIARPIVKLEEDTQIIGSGNLDYKVGTTAKDEIGHLSRAFDKMTVDLKETTASIVELNREISERKQAEVTLRASEEKYRSLFENMRNGFAYCKILLDENNHPIDFVCLEVNDSFETLTGLKKEDVIGKRVTEVIPSIKDTNPELLDIYGEVALTGKEAEFDVYFKPLEIWLSISVYAPQKGYFVAIFDNITERKLAEEQIKASLDEKEILLREIHHRVKNNMQVVISLLRLQSDKIKDQQYVEMLKESQDRIKSMALIHEKLYQSEDFANIDFDGYVKALVNSLFISQGVSPDKISLKMEIADISLGLDYAIPCGLIINELVSNSLKYAFPKERQGEIRIGLQKTSENEVELTVSDNGIGIPEGLDFGTIESLGLDLVKILAEHQLGGKIELNRAGGTSFSFRFTVKTDKTRI